MLNINKKRFLNFFEELKTINATPGSGYTRTVFSKEELDVLDWFENKLREYDLYDYTDSVKNIFGKYGDKEETILIGSHLDTVHNGGLYDGALGVLAGLEVLITLKEQQIDLPYSIQLVAFRGEEGNILGGTFGSRAMTNKIDFTSKFLKDLETTDLVESDVRNAHSNLPYKEYLELHIEQGSILESKGLDIGVVTAIAGLRRLLVKVRGKSGHSGTTPMSMRNDALKKANLILTNIYKFSESLDKDTMLTIGELNVLPNQATVIPNEVNFLVEIRSSSEEHLDKYMHQLKELTPEDSQITVIKPANQLDNQIITKLKNTTLNLGYSHMPIISGANHDANSLADLIPVGMIFVPSRDGISHHPDEYTSDEQMIKGANVLLNYLGTIN